jgi:hypothetical protein
VRRTVFLAADFMAVGAVPPAEASTYLTTLADGFGSISPGLTVSSFVQRWVLPASVTVTGTYGSSQVAGLSAGCSFTWQGPPENYASGAGTGTWGCGGGLAGEGGTLSVDRVGEDAVLLLHGTLEGGLKCHFVLEPPPPAPPAYAFRAFCYGSLLEP